MEEVSRSEQVKNVSDVEAALTKWISTVKMFESQFGETVGDKMKIVIMTSMPPPVILDFVYQNVTRDMLFEVGNRVSVNKESTIMDIGEIGWND